jgi:hypothetical protein
VADPELVASVAADFGVAEVVPSPHVGLPRPGTGTAFPRDPSYTADLRKEAAILPLTVEAGVRTPELVAYDPDAPYLVTRRAAGVPLSQVDDPVPAYRDLGRTLAALHQIRTRPESVPRQYEPDPRPMVLSLARRGLVNTEIVDWLIGWFDRLEHRSPPPPPCLIHGDASPTNLLADGDGLTALIDWGDAAWCDPSVDFAKLPRRVVPTVLEAYGRPEWLPRVLFHHLHWALGRFGTERAAGPHWTAEPASRLLELLRFFVESSDLTNLK